MKFVTFALLKFAKISQAFRFCCHWRAENPKLGSCGCPQCCVWAAPGHRGGQGGFSWAQHSRIQADPIPWEGRKGNSLAVVLEQPAGDMGGHCANPLGFFPQDWFGPRELLGIHHPQGRAVFSQSLFWGLFPGFEQVLPTSPGGVLLKWKFSP